MGIKVTAPGALTTVQDSGRTGLQQYGIPVCGAMDQRAFRAANMLCGNDESAAVLEMTLMGGTFTFTADHVIALTIPGQAWDSPGLARHLESLAVGGAGEIVFVIGGSLGLSDAVIARADEELSMSAMTFPHQLARVMLLEQLYRCARITAGERYHK
ncbi:MAG: 23S rRNA (pseudouridine(1915)-N(3))-methyltransferase RlmH [Firmicutes bacterium]|nr:23S rRNA (pseudouridine(1915)-N(3))-methyltransferase RlmH [Bacillota bacterium]